MQTIYNGNSEKSGIYKIINTVNDRIYVGSAKHFKSRYYQHLTSLRKGTHHNKFLQADFNKCGEASFVFEVLETVEGNQFDRLLAEQAHIDKIYDNQRSCYNIDKKTSKNGRSTFSKTPEETKRKMSEAHLATSDKKSERMKVLWQKESHKEKIKKAMEPHREQQLDTLQKHRTEALKKASETNAKHHGKIIDSCGKAHEVQNLNQFCLQHGLNPGNLTKVINGKMPSHKGWRGYKEELIGVAYESRKKHKEVNFEVVSPDGVVYRETNIAMFAKKHNLSKENLAAVIRGKRKQHKGWTKYIQKHFVSNI